jgi:glycosyltransferase involved in cell wall biosynthesis
MRLAIVTTHPIQYYAPMFRLLAKEPGLEIKVFYTWSQSGSGVKFDIDFGKMIEWDIPLLDGYDYEFVKNIARDPGLHHFNGIRNPDLTPGIRKWKADFLLVIGWNFRSHLGAMRYFKGRIPVLFRGDSTLLDEKPGLKRKLRRIFLKWVYCNVDYALYVGKNNHDYFQIHGLREDQLVWMPHAIDNERFNRNGSFDAEADLWRKNLGIAAGDLVLLFAGKFEPKKDPDFMLRLAGRLSDPRLKLILVGNGKLENALKAKASKDKRLIFLDFQNQQKMPVVYRLCDIFVLPSVGPGETWGLAVNEAMACNRPVIVSAKCGCAADLVKQTTGWVFEPGQEGDLKIKEEVESLMERRSALVSMGAQARVALQPYSYPVAIESVSRLLSSILLC